MLKKALFIILVVFSTATFFACDNGYTINYEASEGGYIDGVLSQSKKFSPVSAIANDGYTFVKWSDGVTEATRTDVKPQDDIKITAEFAQIHYNVKYASSNGGYISGDSIQTIARGKDCTQVEACALEGYKFVKWSDGITDTKRTDLAPQSNMEIIAEFAPIHYTVKYISSDGGYITGKTTQSVAYGNTSEPVSAVADVGYKFLGWSNGAESKELAVIAKEDITVTAVFVMEELNLPIISIVTEDSKPIATKDDYVKCSVSVSNADPDFEFSSKSGKIKLRGNSTAYLPKSPYKLKFDDKIDLFGNGKSKTWTIIANYMDCSLIRNYIAYSLGAEFENLNYTTSFKTAEVYVNGRYDGVYLICEQIEVGSHRVDIDEDYTSANTGYLIEMDSRAPQEGVENIDYFNIPVGSGSINYAIKSPDPEEEDFNDAHVAYIKSYIQQCMTALDGEDFNEVTSLMDVYSFADGYILDELMNCVDIGFSSFYMYKDKDGKLYRGPIWDYDLSTGNCSYQENAVDIEYLWAKETNFWYNRLLKFDEFTEIVANRLAELEDTITSTVTDCYDYVMSHKEAFNRNFNRWEILGVDSSGYSPEEIYRIQTWEGHVDYVINWLELSLENLKNCYPNPC